MNILWCLLLIAALTPLLVSGPNMVPVQSYAVTADNDNYKSPKTTKTASTRTWTQSPVAPIYAKADERWNADKYGVNTFKR